MTDASPAEVGSIGSFEFSRPSTVNNRTHMMKNIFHTISQKRRWVAGIALFIGMVGSSQAAPADRPTIWVQASDRAAILKKIEDYPWAASLYAELKSRADATVAEHQANVETFLRGLPLKGGDAIHYPTIDYITNSSTESAVRYPVMDYLQRGIECGVVYYLTGEDAYAQCGADILTAIVGAIAQLTPSTSVGNGGWVFQADHLKEARVFGAQIPVLYDFVAPFIAADHPVYDLRTQAPGDFPADLAQKVFRTYCDLAIEHGHSGSNWTVLESSSLVQNALALEDAVEQAAKLEYFLSKNTTRQDPLPVIAQAYEESSIWPESLQYSRDVGGFSTILMTLLQRREPALDLFAKYAKIPGSLARENYLRYPNDEYVLFGDGHRTFGVPYFDYEVAYVLAELGGDLELRNFFGALINRGIEEGAYHRGVLPARSGGATVYFTPLRLLWLSGEIEGSEQDFSFPRTDHLPFAGIHIQRNPSEADPVKNGLMGFVGGGSFVHGHASGMNMELYGMGQVLGATGGRDSYTTDIHENYYRIFASHNTVIVNGKSGGKGDWAGLGINRVETVAMEPAPFAEAVSPHHSFTTTSFLDNKQSGTDAEQERTLALIRTSPTSGYYVDVFRSRSTLPDSFHDYVYHNIGDSLSLFDYRGLPLSPASDPDRFAASAALPWVGNNTARNPGWHWFESVKTTPPISNTIKGVFNILRLVPRIEMHVTMPAVASREYTTAMAPASFEAPGSYAILKTPTLVVRQAGDAWAQPFVSVFEPSALDLETIEEVTTLQKDGAFVGLKIVSRPPAGALTQYLILQENADDVFVDAALGLEMTGRFGVVTLNAEGALVSLYLGDGQRLAWGENEVLGNADGAGYLEVGRAGGTDWCVAGLSCL